MGHKIIQTIYTCDLCGKTPEDGGKLWHMNNQVWCESCCDKVENEEIDENGNTDIAAVAELELQNSKLRTNE